MPSKILAKFQSVSMQATSIEARQLRDFVWLRMKNVHLSSALRPCESSSTLFWLSRSENMLRYDPGKSNKTQEITNNARAFLTLHDPQRDRGAVRNLEYWKLG